MGVCDPVKGSILLQKRLAREVSGAGQSSPAEAGVIGSSGDPVIGSFGDLAIWNGRLGQSHRRNLAHHSSCLLPFLLVTRHLSLHFF
jgi:hypothetical protein